MLTYALAPTAEEAAAEVSAGKVQGDPDIATKQASFFLIKIKKISCADRRGSCGDRDRDRGGSSILEYRDL